MASVSPSDFNDFCDYVVRVRESGADAPTPEQSVAQFRREQEKLRAWHDANALSAAQAARGEAKPLDLDAVIDRVSQRLAADRAAE